VSFVYRAAATLGVIAATAIGLSSAPALASAESLTLVLGAKAELGEPYAITAEGVADGAHRLYVYVDPGGAGCAANPSKEMTEVLGAVALSAAEGEALSPGVFTMPYGYTPPASNGYSVCAYLDDLLEGSSDVSAHAGFAAPGGPVEAPYLFNPQVQEELKRIAVEHEQQEERERAKRRAEQEERERVPPTALLHPTEQPPPVQVVPLRVAHCIVPSLKRHSLNAARRSLRHAHCTLGRVERPRHARGPLVVTHQRVRRGTTLHDGAAIAVVLGPASR
jgi:hypothetical protein